MGRFHVWIQVSECLRTGIVSCHSASLYARNRLCFFFFFVCVPCKRLFFFSHKVTSYVLFVNVLARTTHTYVHVQTNQQTHSQLSTRRPGWSWHEPLAGYAPFCYDDTCYDVTEPCLQYGGILLNNVSCAFPEDVKIAGPSCWKGNCTTTGGRDVCNAVGGITVGDDERVQWCLYKDVRTLLGPACYRK
jgi:hypothetical protein